MKKMMGKLVSIVMVMAMIMGMIPAYAAQAESGQQGTFTVCSMNVDGLPNKIAFVTINGDGPGSTGTKAISAKMAEYGWDIIGVSEDFNYNTELMSSLSGYSSGTHRGGVSWVDNDTDGLNLIWKNSLAVTGESWTSWNTEYSTGFAGSGNGADGMIDKGYRYYQAEIADGICVDIYIMHMDADSDAGDIEARESQLRQLVAAIKASQNGNPIIVMGDTNCRYTRENLKTIFIDGINADSRFTVQDTWIEHVRQGDYPVYGSDAIVAVDKGGTYEYPQAEIVDKIFYINNTDSEVTISADYYQVETGFVNSSGTALADHWPVVVQFTYSTEPDHVHEYTVSARKDATCTEAGSVTYTCAGCGDSYSEVVDALSHNYVGVVTKEATCTEAGVKTYTCSKCSDSYTEEIPASDGHNYVGVVTKEATCTEAGVKTYTCSKCSDSYTEEIPASDGHDYVGVVTKEATCTEAGLKTYTCSKCSDSYTEEIPASDGHDYVGVVTKEATCTEAGVKTYTCSKCSDSYTEEIPASDGHDYVGVVTKEATCTEAGVKTYTCSKCSDSYTEVIPAVGHNYVGGVCEYCGDSLVVEGKIVLGEETRAITSGAKYVMVFSGSGGNFSMNHSGTSITAAAFNLSQGDEVGQAYIWTITEVNGKYVFSTEINGQVYYLYRTNTYSGSGFKIGLTTNESKATDWSGSTNNSLGTLRLYDRYGFASCYLRYHNARVGWQASFSAGGVHLYQVVEG